MRQNFSLIYSFLLLVADFFAITLAFTIAYILRVSINITDSPVSNDVPAVEFIMIFAALLPIWMIVFASLGLYSANVYEKRYREWGRLLVGSFVSVMFVISYDFMVERPIFPGKLVPIYAFIASCLLLIVERWVMRKARYGLWQHNIGIGRIVLVGDGEATKVLAGLLKNPLKTGFEVVAIVADEKSVPTSFKGKVFASFDLAEKRLKRLNANTIIQTSESSSDAFSKRVQDAAVRNHMAYKFVPSSHSIYTSNSSVEVFRAYRLYQSMRRL